jgi:hypothetical protein
MDIVEERAKSYGDPAENITRIAALWSAYLGVEIYAHDVSWMMVMLKASRSKNDPGNLDNYEDGHGYVEIAERLRFAEKLRMIAHRRKDMLL